MSLQIGDRVQVVGNSFESETCLSGKKGTVVCFSAIGNIGVRFDEPFKEGHSCDNKCPYGYGRYGPEKELVKLINDKPEPQKPVVKHVIVKDSCGNFMAFRDDEASAIEYAKSSGDDNITVYKMIEVAKIKSKRMVVKVTSQSKTTKSKK